MFYFAYHRKYNKKKKNIAKKKILRDKYCYSIFQENLNTQMRKIKLNKNCIQKAISHQLATRKLNSICGTLMKAQLFSETVLSCYNFSGKNKGVGIRKDVSPDS